MTGRYGIFEIAKDETPIGKSKLTGPLDECLACISVAQLNERILATNQRQSAREIAQNQRDIEQDEREEQLNERETDLSAREARQDTFDKQRAEKAKADRKAD